MSCGGCIVDFDGVSRYGNHLYAYGGGYCEIIGDEERCSDILRIIRSAVYDRIVGPDRSVPRAGAGTGIQNHYSLLTLCIHCGNYFVLDTRVE
jgi:hypothetical protein